MKTTYRVYEAPDGCGTTFCGEFASEAEAQEYAATEPSGLSECLYETARQAGHVCGMEAPDGGTEDDDPVGWYGAAGWHCVVRVRYATYRIDYTDGRTADADTYDEAIEILEAEYPDLEYGHDGDLTEGGTRTLCWACEDDAQNDDGARAVASIVQS